MNAREVKDKRQIKELHADCLAALQPRPQTICLKGFLKCQGNFSLLEFIFSGRELN